MNENDAKAHPWPPKGDWVEWRWRDAVWMPVRPWYEANNVDYKLEDIWFLALFKGKFPFLTWNIKVTIFGSDYGIHGYIGWKPIPVAKDPAFDWSKLDVAQKLIREGRLFVQLSMRGGVGSIG